VLLAAAAACPFAVACTLAFGPDDSFSSGKSGTDSGPLAEGSVLEEASTPAEAGGDGGGGDSGDGGTFCSRAPVGAQLCDDFERDGLLGPWTKVQNEGDSGLALVREDSNTFLRAVVKMQSGSARSSLSRAT